MKWIVGLGNPGSEYADHRHNFGFWVADFLAKQNGWKWEKSPLAQVAWGEIEKEECWLAKPLTYMNLSGKAVKVLLNEKRGEAKDLIVIHDDLDLPLGKIRWAFASGHGGHNGIRSIADILGTPDFHRIRLGVGRPVGHADPAEYVLQPFVGEERKEADAVVKRAAQSIPDFLKHGLQWVQNKYH